MMMLLVIWAAGMPLKFLLRRPEVGPGEVLTGLLLGLYL